jgi:hypothetical protein
LTGEQAVIDEVRGEQLVERVQISFDLRVDETAGYGLVLLRQRHSSFVLLCSPTGVFSKGSATSMMPPGSV